MKVGTKTKLFYPGCFLILTRSPYDQDTVWADKWGKVKGEEISSRGHFWSGPIVERDIYKLSSTDFIIIPISKNQYKCFKSLWSRKKH